MLDLLVHQQRFHRFTAQLGDFTFQATHTGFAGVIADNANDGAVVDRQLTFFQGVTLKLLRQQVLLGDIELLVLGVAGQANHFHTIQQRRRNVHRVRGSNEHHVGQIVIHFQVVIVKRHVLFRIQHFKQCRSRIATHVGRHLVDFVQQEQRVFHPDLGHFLDQFTRHRADVGTTVTANFRFVTHAAQRHTHILATGRFGDRLSQRGFTYARRPHQTQDRPFDFAYAALYCEILKNTVLDSLQAIVIDIEHFLRFNQVFFNLAARIPRHLQHPVDVTTNHGRFRRHG
ncbi:hypothetical protein D3C72_954870 [compost metagenome]